MNQLKKYHFYSDAGHGWMAVKRQELLDLGILHTISSYSYQRGKTVYLEEDSDATKFFNAYEKKFGIKPAYIHIQGDDVSPIRRYDRFVDDRPMENSVPVQAVDKE